MRIVVSFALLVASSAPAFAYGEYVKGRVDGYFKYCYYSDGGVLTVGNTNACPHNNEGLAGQVDLQTNYDTGLLASEEIIGNSKYCHYYGGASVPIPVGDTCPRTSK